MTAAITASHVAAPVQAELPVLTNGVTPAPDLNTNAVDKAYMTHMTAKVGEYAKDKGENCVLYLRRNGKGEQKLAYCLASKWTGLKDRAIIGAVAMIEA